MLPLLVVFLQLCVFLFFGRPVGFRLVVASSSTTPRKLFSGQTGGARTYGLDDRDLGLLRARAARAVRLRRSISYRAITAASYDGAVAAFSRATMRAWLLAALVWGAAAANATAEDVALQTLQQRSLNWAIDWGIGNKTFCNEHCVNTTLCSTYIGWKLHFGARSPVDDPSAQCKFLRGNSRYYNSNDLTNYLGDGGVVVLTGDSIMRHLFIELLNFLGEQPYAAWWRQLHEESTRWRGQHRDKLEHTYLCSPPLGPRSLTLAFLWHPLWGEHLSHLPFLPPDDPTRCQWSAEDSVRGCDHSPPDGATERWPCRSLLDSIQLPGQPQRRFVLVASTGAHTAMNEIHETGSVNVTETIALSANRYKAAWHKLESARPHWSAISKDGGRNIFLTPARLSYGAPRTTNANHVSADRMEAISEAHIRAPLRAGPSNLTCGQAGLEVVDTSPVFFHANSPGSAGDGVHQEQITNVALIQLLVHRLLNFNASSWRQDRAGWSAGSWQRSSCL